MWRYQEFLPIYDQQNIVTLGEGWTPLIRMQNIGKMLGLKNVFLKDEGVNPTGTFKARGASACVSKLKELGVRALGLPTAGNAGGAFACYAAKAGIEAHIAMPTDAPESTRKQTAIAGAKLYLINGKFDESIEFMKSRINEYGWFNASTFKEPWRVEGKKTMGLELFDQFGGDLPEVILYPTGGGLGLVAIWKAFEELHEIGWLRGSKPRIFSVQASGLQRLKKALDEQQTDTVPWENITTNIPGMAGPSKSLGDALCLQIIRKSDGDVIVVEDTDVFSDMKNMASLEGEFICPEGASTLTALKQLKDRNLVYKDDRVVLLNTGTGLKYLEFVSPETS
jgi:threonine synthase